MTDPDHEYRLLERAGMLMSDGMDQDEADEVAREMEGEVCCG